MATSTANLVHDNSSLANFKSWAQFVSNAFSAFGWTQTADTGQVNWATIASVPSNNFVYEIWQMSDALQASCPVFVKVHYGFSSTTVRMALLVGQGSDGAGNLTGAVSNFNQSDSATNQGVSTFPCFASGDTGSFRLLMWQNGTGNAGHVWGIERSKDATGVNTADYVTFLGGDANNGTAGLLWNFQSFIAGNPNPGNNYATNNAGGLPCTVYNPNQTGLFNGTVSALPTIPLIGKPGNPMLDWCGAANQDITEGATGITVSIYGANHNYIATKQNRLGQLGWGILMRYE